jgi:TolB-like protein
LLAVILVTLVIVAIAGLWVIRVRQRDLAKTTGIHSLAVLPFQSIGDPSLSYLGLGMTDALVTRLGNQSRMTVRTMSAVRKYVGETDPLRVGRELGVDAVLDGTSHRATAAGCKRTYSLDGQL